MKEFDLQKAMQGAALCTRTGLEAVVTNFGGRGDRPLIGFIEDEKITIPFAWEIDGKVEGPKDRPGDLMMVNKTIKYAVKSDDHLTFICGKQFFDNPKEIETLTGCDIDELDIVKVISDN